MTTQKGKRGLETIIEIAHPFKRVPRHKWQKGLPLRWKLSWLFQWGGGSVQEFGGSRVNTQRHLSILGWHILTIHRNQYHDRSDAERAEEYLRRWSECEKELRGLRLIMLGDSTGAEIKKVIRESLGVDLDEGTIR
jgi:hypothetical protein